MSVRALQVFEQMVLQGFQPEMIPYTLVISSCGKGWKAKRTCRPLKKCGFPDYGPK